MYSCNLAGTFSSYHPQRRRENCSHYWSSSNAFVSGAGGLRFKSQAGQIGQCCQRLATAATFLRKELCCPGVLTRRWAPPTRYTLRRNPASIMKHLILIWFTFSKSEKSTWVLSEWLFENTPTLKDPLFLRLRGLLLVDWKYSLFLTNKNMTQMLNTKRLHKR